MRAASLSQLFLKQAAWPINLLLKWKYKWACEISNLSKKSALPNPFLIWEKYITTCESSAHLIDYCYTIDKNWNWKYKKQPHVKMTCYNNDFMWLGHEDWCITSQLSPSSDMSVES